MASEAPSTGDRIRFYRLLRRKTMQELADEAGCSLHTVWRAETDRNTPRYKTRQRIAEALGVDSWDLSYNPLPKTPEEAATRRPSDPEISIYKPTEEDLREGQEIWDEYYGRTRSRKERRKKQRPTGRARGRKNKKRKKR